MKLSTLVPQKLRRRRGTQLEDRSPFWVGVVAIGVVATIGATLLGIRAAGVGFSEYSAEFAQAAQLSAGDAVMVAGVDVGQVTDVELDGTQVRVRMQVRNSVPLGQATRAAIKLTTLLGSRYVELHPAGPGTLEHHRITLPNTDVPYDLQSLLSDATTTVEDLDVDRMVKGLGVLSDQLTGLPDALPQAMSNLQKLSGIIADRRTQIGDLLRGAALITQTLHRQQSNLGQLIVQGRDLLADFARRRQAFHTMMTSVTRLVDLLSNLMGTDRASFEGLLTNLKALTAMFSDHDDKFRNLLQVMPIPLRNITNGTGTAPALEFNFAAGLLIDDWMCAISGRAKQFNLPEYFKDCA